MKLELGIMAGPESKAFLSDLTKQIDRLEKLVCSGLKTISGNTVIENREMMSEAACNDQMSADKDEDDDFQEAAPAKPKRGRPRKVAAAPAPAAFDDEDVDNDSSLASEIESEAEDEDSDDDDDFDSVKAAPPAKAKKITIDDVNDACKKKAASLGAGGVPKVRAILKKNFKTESVRELKPEQYGACIQAMAV